MSLSLVLVRHGHTIWSDTGGVAGRSDIDLSVEGQSAVKQLASTAESSLVWQSLHSSPLKRTRQTMQLLCDGMVLVHEQYENEMKVWGEDWINRAPPNGETFAEQAARCQSWLDDYLCDRLTPRNSLVVLHGGSIRALLCLCLGWPLTRAMDFAIDPAKATTICFDAQTNSWVVRGINLARF